MYAGRLNTVQIPQISTSDNRMQTILADIFRINRDVDYKKYKYIFLNLFMKQRAEALEKQKY